MTEPLIEQIEREAQAYWDFMSQEEREQFAWLAGIIDGEGTIGIYRTKREWYRLVLRIQMTHKPTMIYIRELTNHIGYMNTLYREGCKPAYAWRVVGKTAASILRQCLPYLHTKKYQALLGIEFHNIQQAEKGGRGRLLELTRIARKAREEEIRQALLEANK